VDLNARVHCTGTITGRELAREEGATSALRRSRALKRTNDNLDEILDARDAEPCPECGADPGHDHASWCMYDKEAEEKAW